jgi:hypothetical protein
LTYTGGQLRRIKNAVTGPAAGCPTSPDPFFASGGGVFVNGVWVARDHPMAAGAGTGTPSGGCTTVKPAADWLCINGGWVPPNHPLALGSSGGGTSGGTGGDTGGGTGGGSGTPATCTTVKPASDWVCVNGGWVPPNHPLATGSGGSTGGTGGTGGGGTGGGTTGCTTVKPAPDWICKNGGWLPPGHPLAGGS